MIELDQILAGLVQRTSEGRLKWRRGALNDRFVTSVDVISVVIMDLDHPGPTHYGLDILDESGEIVESLHYPYTNAEQDRELTHLYLLARRQALNADSTLEKLAKALDL